MQKYITHIGLTFLVYLSESDSLDFSFYFELTGPDTCKQQLIEDLKIGAIMDVDTFFRILLSLYRECSDHMARNVEALEVVITNLDPSNLYKLVCWLTMQEFSIFSQTNIEQVSAVFIQITNCLLVCLDIISGFGMGDNWSILCLEINGGWGSSCVRYSSNHPSPGRDLRGSVRISDTTNPLSQVPQSRRTYLEIPSDVTSWISRGTESVVTLDTQGTGDASQSPHIHGSHCR